MSHCSFIFNPTYSSGRKNKSVNAALVLFQKSGSRKEENCLSEQSYQRFTGSEGRGLRGGPQYRGLTGTTSDCVDTKPLSKRIRIKVR